MDVRMPDGRIVTNVPEGITQSELTRRLGLHDSQAGMSEVQKLDAATKAQADAYAGGDTGTMGAMMRGLGGAKHAWDRAAFGLKGLVTDLTPEDRQLLQQGSAFTRQTGPAARVGEFAGDVAITAPIGGAATGALRLGTAALPRVAGAGARLAGELASGAGIGALTSPEDRERGALGGAAGSAAGMGLSRLVGGLVRPMVSPEARRLMDQGIQPSIGQSVGGWLGKAEEKAASLPLVGGAIARARNRAVDEFNEAAIRKAAPEVEGIGDAALGRAREAIGAKYGAALDRMPQRFTVEAEPIMQAVVAAADDPALALSRESQGRVLDYVQRHLLDRSSSLSPDIAKRIESDMGAAVARLRGSSAGEDRAVGEALGRVHAAWRQSLTDIAEATSPGAGRALREADQQWRAFRAVDRAGASAGAQAAEETGRFTPRQLQRAIEAEDKTQFNRATRYGTVDPASPFGEVNALTRDAQQVLPSRVPDSGTAGRLGLPLAAGAGLAGGVKAAAIAAAAMPAAMAAYSRTGQRALTEGLQPALDALAARGYAPEQAARLVKQWGPDAVLAVFRAGAAQAAEPAR